ncbi:alpha/beta hydrolase [Flavitalea sp. BT771]|uniref:alpha/beta fold hydrolase n=1 Tax=Flavitalea sp. BT771 TaxID=3063329 RepID=UPI0026E26096|nr:alpha/beta hydrolase [Flavitalea sp. BT771]MDO6432979.1 alpha/beta hydrolase [Flavitalea sp. BT771]MDV6221745.1 alpha/beta hydrolase [Flavitalea sp. BT771]
MKKNFFCLLVCMALVRTYAAEYFIDAGHLRVHCVVSGTGPALLLVHAGYQDLYMWDRQEAYFKKHYKVVRIDMPGHGATTGIDTSLLVADVIRIVLDSLHVQQTAVVGLSMGAACATDFTLAYPQRVTRLIVVSPGLSGWPAVMKMDTATRRTFQIMDSIHATGDHRLMAEYFTSVWCDGPYRKPGEVDTAVRGYIYRTTMQNKMDVGAFPVFNPKGAATRLKEIHCPVLIIQGDKDIPFILQVTNWYRHELPSARLVNFPGVAHMLNMERPEAFNKVLEGWMSGKG